MQHITLTDYDNWYIIGMRKVKMNKLDDLISKRNKMIEERLVSKKKKCPEDELIWAYNTG